MTVRDFPVHPKDLTAELLGAVIAEQHPGAGVRGFEVIDSKVYGDGMVSTAGRIVARLDYTPGTPDNLPTRVVIKIPRADDDTARPLYANETAFYQRLRSEVGVEAPFGLGSVWNPDNGAFGLILGDLTEQGVQFPNATLSVSQAQLRAIIDQLAALHARYWRSPRFAGDLAWVETHLEGGLYELFNNPGLVPAHIAHQVDTEQFKREMVERLRTDAQTLFQGVAKVQRHQSRLPQTLLHGDTHIGNTYLLPGDRGGLLDWQLMVRGYGLHDLTYLLVTAQSVAARRANERELIAYYLDRLRVGGVTDAPDFDTAWLEYRRAAVWGVYIGWLTTPVANYGWEICVINHLRLMTAYEDLETEKALATID